MPDEHASESRNKLVIFHAADAPSLQEAGRSTGRTHVTGEPIEDFFSEAITKDCSITVPFREASPDGFSLGRLDLPPGAMLPRHSHSADCLYYVVSGEILLGSRELGPGDGFFAPAEQPYAYGAGPDGVVVLEFRHSTAYDTKFHEKDPKHFRAKAEASLAAAATGQGRQVQSAGPNAMPLLGRRITSPCLVVCRKSAGSKRGQLWAFRRSLLRTHRATRLPCRPKNE